MDYIAGGSRVDLAPPPRCQVTSHVLKALLEIDIGFCVPAYFSLK